MPFIQYTFYKKCKSAKCGVGIRCYSSNAFAYNARLHLIFSHMRRRTEMKEVSPYYIDPLTLGVPLDGIVCFSHTFENNLRIK